MVLNNVFIHYRTPAQFIYWGENYVEIYRREDTEKTFKKIRTIADISSAKVTSSEFYTIARDLLKVETGLIMNSGPFIFNIFEFEKLPLVEQQKKELVEWRLKKVFPENIADYEHDYFRLSRNRVLSVLLKKSLKEKIEGLCSDNGITLTYLGNSTVETMNYIARLKKDSPDFFIEIDKNLSIMVFLGKNLPYYIRKFRSGKVEDIAAEVVKTINFVKSSYTQVPRTCSLVIRVADEELHPVHDELAKMEIRSLEMKNSEQLLFPA